MYSLYSIKSLDRITSVVKTWGTFKITHDQFAHILKKNLDVILQDLAVTTKMNKVIPARRIIKL